MRKKLKKGEIYKFEWNDTYGLGGWYDEDQIDDRTVDGIYQISTGFLIKETKDWYILATHHNKNDTLDFPTWGAVSWIPKGSVQTISSYVVCSS